MGMKALAKSGKHSHYGRMLKQLISEIEAYARAAGVTPQMVLRAAVGAGWGTWDSWLADAASPTFRTADRIHAYMRANPPKGEAGAVPAPVTTPDQEDAA